VGVGGADQRIAWTSVDEPRQAGVVTFHRLDDTKTRVMLQLDFDPEGFVEGGGPAAQSSAILTMPVSSGTYAAPPASR
jgi:uncharacterized membrane protein